MWGSNLYKIGLFCFRHLKDVCFSSASAVFMLEKAESKHFMHYDWVMVLWSFWFCKFISWSSAKPKKCCLLFREAFLSYWKLSGLEDEACLWFLGECSCMKTQVNKECIPALLCWTHWENTPYGNLELAAVIWYWLKHVWNCSTDKGIIEKPWFFYFLCKSNMQFGNTQYWFH